MATTTLASTNPRTLVKALPSARKMPLGNRPHAVPHHMKPNHAGQKGPVRATMVPTGIVNLAAAAKGRK